MTSFFQLSFTIDEILAAQITSTTDAQKWVSHELGELRALVRDMQDNVPFDRRHEGFLERSGMQAGEVTP